MKRMDTRPAFDRFLDSVCRHVRAKQLHRDITDELSAHLDELVEENLANGMTEKEAVDLAVARMGEPEQIGRELDHTHRPRTDWGMLLLIALLSGVGLLTMYHVQMNGTGPFSDSHFFEKKMIHIGLGAVLMIVLSAMDYQKLKKYSEYIFAFGVLLLVWVYFFGMQRNGQPAWFEFGSMSFYIPTVSIFALIVGFAGSKPLRECDWKGSILLIAYRGLLPMFLLMKINVVALAAVYTAIFIVYLCFTRRNIWQLAAFVGGCVVVALYIVTNHYYMMSRLLGFLNRTDDPTGGDYMITRSMDAMQSAGWLGKGGMTQPAVPYPYSEGFLPSFIYAFGWAAGLVVLTLILGFIGKTMITTAHMKEEYGKLLFAGIGSMFVIQYLWAVAMIFGYAPFVGISMPFVSYGGTDQVIQFAAIGLLLSAYRRKNMVALVDA